MLQVRGGELRSEPEAIAELEQSRASVEHHLAAVERAEAVHDALNPRLSGAVSVVVGRARDGRLEVRGQGLPSVRTMYGRGRMGRSPR